jgi:hypothetical protein
LERGFLGPYMPSRPLHEHGLLWCRVALRLAILQRVSQQLKLWEHGERAGGGRAAGIANGPQKTEMPELNLLFHAGEDDMTRIQGRESIFA